MSVILIPTSKGKRAISIDSIIKIEASSNYCKIYFNEGYPLTVAKLLQWFEETLQGHSFYRVHRGHIVNCKYIASISKSNEIRLMNGEILQVSKRKKTAFRKMVA